MVTRRGPWPVGAPCWVTLGTDVDRAAAFYAAVLGWRVEPTGVGGHATAHLGAHRVAGLWPRQDPDAPAGWCTHLSAVDAKLDAARVEHAGGTLLVPPTTVWDLGSTALAADPTGAVFALWQSGAHTGFEVAGEPGAVVWSEHRTPDPVCAKGFYTEAFGFTYQDDGSGDDLVSLDVGEPPVAAIGPGEGGWTTTFGVADLRGALAEVVRRGGQVRAAGEVVDDQGAVFRLREVPPGP
ncbi:VOC family protein [Actinokineospora bangkokensis]|uniref:VOC domain-containing protein n=1 Tax=Actinokineospora bangkokensis TaxID=1193682 RepID=A0A1Q9LSF8_9PSEU|nr:VOC family protein [Actinokineospora bangkokensis]OLR94976.1 hypothetical protein BJP25_08380 [Actinokineospora bangkokensis]